MPSTSCHAKPWLRQRILEGHALGTNLGKGTRIQLHGSNPGSTYVDALSSVCYDKLEGGQYHIKRACAGLRNVCSTILNHVSLEPGSFGSVVTSNSALPQAQGFVTEAAKPLYGASGDG